MNDASKPLAIAYDDGNGEAKPLPKKESVALDIGQVLACCELLPSSGKEEEGQVRRVVYVHGVDGKMCVVATDGSNVLICSKACSNDLQPAWAKQGVLLHAPQLKSRAKFIAGEDNAVCTVAWDGVSRFVELASPGEDIVMRVAINDAMTFPAYDHLVAQLDFSASFQDFEGFGLNTNVAKSLAALANKLTIAWDNKAKPKPKDGYRLKVYPAGPNKPLAVEFLEVPGALLIVMPQAVDQRLSVTARDLLSPAAKGTLAALRAHRTRIEQQMAKAKTQRDKTTLGAKIAEYDQRIARVMASAGVALEDKTHAA